MEIFRFNILPTEEIEKKRITETGLATCPQCKQPLKILTQKKYAKIDVIEICSICKTEKCSSESLN